MSLKSRREWILPEEKTEEVVKEILKLRDIEDEESFLSPQIEDVPDHTHLYNSKKAAKRLIKAVKNGEKIVIHGDYDADGISSTSLLWNFLYRDVSQFLDKEVDILPYIPDRVEQGYGLTEDSLNDVIDLGAKLVVTVDCGVRDRDLIRKYIQDKKLDFIVTDHHLLPDDLLDKREEDQKDGVLAYPLVHQMYPGKEYPDTEICGAAVVYLLIQAIREFLGMDKDLRYGLDLVALATVTDVMPLLGVNRIFVKEGLEEIRKGERIGLRMLALRAGLTPEEIEAYHLGFVLGPRINASGRISSPMEGVRLLVSNSEAQCKETANTLEMTNFERQKMTTEIFEKAKESVQDSQDNLLFILGDDWHEGIIGLVAGKIQQLYYRPVIVATKSEGAIKGSARSIKGFNITKAFDKFKKHLDRYGGHELAAGFSTTEKKVEDFRKNLVKYANEEITEEQLTPKLNIEILLDSEDITKELVNELRKLEPLGFGNPKPTICVRDLTIKEKRVIGKDNNHLKLVVKGSNADVLTLLLFGCDEDVETLNEGDSIDVVGYPDINVWNGRENIQFNVKEWR
ncbi:MAG: single-stranded-DNA-specific exonuclease RecJ [Candidatus Dojkabacteria bacterium]